MIDTHTQTQAMTIPGGQNWPRVIKRNYIYITYAICVEHLNQTRGHQDATIVQLILIKTTKYWYKTGVVFWQIVHWIWIPHCVIYIIVRKRRMYAYPTTVHVFVAANKERPPCICPTECNLTSFSSIPSVASLSTFGVSELLNRNNDHIEKR